MIAVIKFIDKRIGNVICRFLGIFSRKSAAKYVDLSPKKILVIQLWGIGETVLTLPAIEALRLKYPQSRIEILTTSRNKDVYFENKNINDTIQAKLNPFSIIWFILKNFRKYELAIDMEEYLNISSIITFFASKFSVGFSHESRSKLYTVKVAYNDKQHAALTFLDLIKAIGTQYELKKLPGLNFSSKDKKFVDNFLKKNKIKKGDFLACVAPGAAESAKSRMWPHERYAELCDEMLARHNIKIIFAGTQNESELIDEIIKKIEHKERAINSAGKVSLIQLFYLVSKCRIFIGNDSGPMHIAAAQGVKTLGLFGPNLPQRFGPFGEGNVGLYKGYNCEFSPCVNVHKGQVPDCLYPRNSNDYQKCMKNINMNDVVKEVEKMI